LFSSNYFKTLIVSKTLNDLASLAAARRRVYYPHADDERAAVPGREPGRHVYQVSDRPGTTASLPGDPSFHRNATTHAKREQSTRKAAALR